MTEANSNNNNNNNNNNNYVGGGGGGLAGSQPLVRNIANSVGAIAPQTGSLVARSSPLVSRPPTSISHGSNNFIDNSNDNESIRADSYNQLNTNNSLLGSDNVVPSAPVLDHPLANTPPKPEDTKQYKVDIHAADGESDEIEVVRNSPSHTMKSGMYHHQRQLNSSAAVPTSVSSNMKSVKGATNLGSFQQPITASPISVPASASTSIHNPSIDKTRSNTSNLAKISEKNPSIALTLDEEADEFLKGNDSSENELSGELVGMQLLNDFEKRRGWSDILSVSLDLLQSSSSPYHPIYSKLVSTSEMEAEVGGNIQDHVSNVYNETFLIISLRLKSYVKIRKYSELSKELEQIKHLELYNIVPFWFKVCLVKQRQFVSSRIQCIDSLNSLIAAAITPTEVILCLCPLSNLYFLQQEYRMALETLDQILNLLDEFVISNLSSCEYVYTSLKGIQSIEIKDMFFSSFLSSSRIEILSRQGRIFLQMGAITEALHVFEVAQNFIPEVLITLNTASKDDSMKYVLNSLQIINAAPMQLLLNEGLLLFSQKKFDMAFNKFRALIETQRKSRYISSSRNERWLSVQDFVMPALNNMALSAFYSCRLDDAISSMEALVKESPTRYLTDDLVFNLCTLYELVADGVGRKKRVLQVIAKRYVIQDISPSSFRTG